MFEDLPEPKFVVQDKSIKKMKITPNKNLEKLAKKIKNKYKKQQQRKGLIKKASKKKLDDLEAIGYNSVMQKLNLPQHLKQA